MVHKHHVVGYEASLEYIKGLKVDGPVLVLYCGTNLPSGESWCSDCVKAKPYTDAAVEKFAPESAHYVHVEVGDRQYWKDKDCPFRKDSQMKLNVLPTLSLWGTQRRLQGDECEDSGLIELMITEKDD